MSAAARALFVGVAVLLAALIAGFFYFRAQTDYAVLYSHFAQTRAMMDRLTAAWPF